MSKLERYTVTMPRELLQSFDRSIKKKGYRNRSEALRDLVRNELVRDAVEDPDRKVAATINIVFDYKTNDLCRNLAEVQHEFIELIVSTMGVHLDRGHCMEVVILRGDVKSIRKMEKRIIALRGIKHFQLCFNSDGPEII